MVYQMQRAVRLQVPEATRIDIQFDNITFAVNQGRKEKKTILKNISGCFRSGELTAIMGPSGAGKSTLLNILTGFQRAGIEGTLTSTTDEGVVRNGCDAYSKDACYILQDDRLNPIFTVIEIMRMACELKLGDSINQKSKDYLLNDILDTIGLNNSLDTRCGRLSGGQKKRLSIALELIDNPPIMFLDEPTTGLDSLSSLQCIGMLKKLARDGRTIVCTIHQPSASIYEMFDQVYVVARGQCVYQGDNDMTLAFLKQIDLPCPEYYNPADHLIEVASGDYGDVTDQMLKCASDPCWRQTDRAQPVSHVVSDKRPTSSSVTHNNNLIKSVVLVNPPSELFRFKILLWRSFLQMYRDWTVTHLKLILHTLVGIFIGVFYLDFGKDAYHSVSNVGYSLVTLVYLSYTAMMPAVLRLPSEIPVLKKERFNNWYNLKTYYAAFLVSSIPVQILFASVYTIISYTISGQIMQFSRISMYLLIVIICVLIAEGFGIFFGTLVNPINGTFLSCIMLALFLVVGGFLMLFSHMSSVMYLLTYVSFISYGIDAMVQATYGFQRETLLCPEEYTYCHYSHPTELLQDLGMSQSNYWHDLTFLVILLFVMRFVGFCTLRRKLTLTI